MSTLYAVKYFGNIYDLGVILQAMGSCGHHAMVLTVQLLQIYECSEW